jgi:hypothetical protein
MKRYYLNQIRTFKIKTVSLTFNLFTSNVNLTKISFFLAITWLSINPEFLQAQPRPWMPPGIEMVAKAKGRTHGHIADFSITNTTGQTVSIEIPPVRIPNSAPNPAVGRAAQQGFIIPEPTNVDVPPNATVETPLHGYCTDPDLPPPAVGSDLPPVDTWDPDAPLIQQAQDIIRTVSDLQNNGHIQTPFSGNPPREREALIQQTLWWYSAGPSYDPCTHISQSLANSFRDTDWYVDSSDSPPSEQEKTPVEKYNLAMPTANPWFAVLKSRSDAEKIYHSVLHSIAEIITAMIRVGHELDHPDISMPSVPADLPPITPPDPAEIPDSDDLIRVKGTGRTTGHIADITVSNPTSNPITIHIGDGNPIFIPSNGREQSYVVPPIPPIQIDPGQTVTIPIDGYCADVRKPPVGVGENMPPISEWIGANPADRQIPPFTRSTDEPPREIVNIPLQTAPPLSMVNDILENIPAPSFPANWDCPDLPAGTNVLIPGTDTPLRSPLSSTDNPELAVPVIIEALDRIIKATDDLIADGAITTPFSNTPVREREAVIQQTFWMFTSALEGNPYVKEDFSKKTIEQFETSTGRPVSSIPQTQRDQLEMGVDDFWNTFQAVGAEAKILPVVPVTPTLPVPADIFDSTYDRKVYWDIPPGTTTDDRLTTSDPVFQQKPDEDDDNKKTCELTKDDVEFKITLVRKEESVPVSFQAILKNGKYVFENTSKSGFQKDDQLIITCEPKLKCECKGEVKTASRSESWDYGECTPETESFNYDPGRMPLSDYLTDQIDSIITQKAEEKIKEEKAIIESLKNDIKDKEKELKEEREKPRREQDPQRIRELNAEIKDLNDKLKQLETEYNKALVALKTLINSFYKDEIETEKNKIIDENKKTCTSRFKLNRNASGELSIKYQLKGKCVPIDFNSNNCKEKPFEITKIIEISATR